MWELWSKRLIGLLSVKSIVTLILTAVFAALAISGKVSSQDFFTIFSVVIAFYFGSKSQKEDDRGDAPERKDQGG